mmetsp:Transcript_114993/g.199427  ORF Transcript_114993/g.199427 Transcript_114993/m.199427 type:complete len:726 (-) Transcript_114993:87-2264(-)
MEPLLIPVILCLLGGATADLRIAAHEWPGYRCYWPNAASMKNLHCKYMMPGNFSYRGLKLQSFLAHDQYCRSNIDNEQDNRDFKFETGMDHLPFRTDNGEVNPIYSYQRRENGKLITKTVDTRATVQPGQSMLVPLRWNNPHSSELEVNIWILQGKQPVVVPVRKPTCSGEGYQDNIVRFTVPRDFADLGAKIPGFTGCNENSKPMCVLQIYSHSVESRTYAIGFPIIIPGHNGRKRTSSTQSIQSVSIDPGMDLSNLRDLCLPNTDSSADIPTARPRWARLVSDVYNHAYQNSDYSPYSGQQHESISKNLQASAINKMVVANRGELGRSILPEDTYKRLKALRTLEDKVYKNYESLANKIIKKIGSEMASTGTIQADGTKQKLETCFRCAEVGSIRTKRLETNTYIPSFQLPTSLQAKAKDLVLQKYAGLITSSGQVQIYQAALADLLPFFFVSAPYGIMYQEAMQKTTLTTMADTTAFQKNRGGRYNIDYGQYASTAAKNAFAEKHGCPKDCLKCTQGEKPLIKGSAATCATGKCSGCAVLFSNYHTAVPPPVSKLAVDMASSGVPEIAKDDQVPQYPDNDGTPRFGRPAQHRRRNAAEKEASQEASKLDEGWNLRMPPSTPPPTPPPSPPPTPASPSGPWPAPAPTWPAPAPTWPLPAPSPTPMPAPSARRRRRRRSSRRRSKSRRRRRSSRRRSKSRRRRSAPASALQSLFADVAALAQRK